MPRRVADYDPQSSPPRTSSPASSRSCWRRRSSSSSITSSSRGSLARRRWPIPGTRSRWSGRCRRQCRWRTLKRCQWSPAGRTTTASQPPHRYRQPEEDQPGRRRASIDADSPGVHGIAVRQRPPSTLARALAEHLQGERSGYSIPASDTPHHTSTASITTSRCDAACSFTSSPT